MLTVYTPVPGDVLVPDFGGPALTVQSVSTVAGQRRAQCTWQAGTATLSGSFLLSRVSLLSSATGAPFFTLAPSGGNTGSGSIAGAIANGALWVPGAYAASFARYDFGADPLDIESAYGDGFAEDFELTTALQWTVTDSSENQLATGLYLDPAMFGLANGGAGVPFQPTVIAFRGIELSVSGSPAPGDAFTLAPVAF